MLQAIHIVNPQTLRVEKTLTSDQSGNSLTNAQNKSRTWNDVAYVEVCICPCFQYMMNAHMPAPCPAAGAFLETHGGLECKHKQHISLE